MKTATEYLEELVASQRFDNDTFLIAVPGESSRDFARNAKRIFVPDFEVRTEHREKEKDHFYLDFCTKDKKAYAHIARSGVVLTDYNTIETKFGFLPTASGAVHAKQMNTNSYVALVSNILRRLQGLNWSFIIHHKSNDEIQNNGCLYIAKPV